MGKRSSAGSVEEYIRGFPPPVREKLEEIRALIAQAAPGASQTISYAIPTFDLDGEHLVHFAGFERHIGFYPTPSAVAAFKEELRQYKHAKGSVQFPLDKALPEVLIRRMVEFRAREVASGRDA